MMNILPRVIGDRPDVLDETRHYQIGKLMRANYLVAWRSLISDEDSPIKMLMKWSLMTEKNIFLGSIDSAEYHRLLHATMEEALKVKGSFREELDDQFRNGLVTEDHPTFNLSQSLTMLMRFSKIAPDRQLANSFLYIVCGMMKLDEPLETPELIGVHDPRGITDADREYSTFSLLQTIFPQPVMDGDFTNLKNLLEFGYDTEGQIWDGTRNEEDYNNCIDRVCDQLMMFRDMEDQYLTQMEAGLVYPVDTPPPEDDEEEEEEDEEEEEGEDDVVNPEEAPEEMDVDVEELHMIENQLMEAWERRDIR